MKDIYEQHKAAFARVSGYVVINQNGERVATIAFKFPRDGAGRLYCYLHIIGLPMVRGFANGYGYDKRSAAFVNAVYKIKLCEVQFDWTIGKFQCAAQRADAGTWNHELEVEDYTVWQAI